MEPAVISFILIAITLTLTVAGFVRDLIQDERQADYRQVLAENLALKDKVVAMQATIDALRELVIQRGSITQNTFQAPVRQGGVEVSGGNVSAGRDLTAGDVTKRDETQRGD